MAAPAVAVDGTQNTKRDVYKLNNSSPTFRRLTASENLGLGDLLEKIINRINAIETFLTGTDTIPPLV